MKGIFRIFLAALAVVLSVGIAQAQVKTVSGVVVSADNGEPLIGAAVTIDGSATL